MNVRNRKTPGLWKEQRANSPWIPRSLCGFPSFWSPYTCSLGSRRAHPSMLHIWVILDVLPAWAMLRVGKQGGFWISPARTNDSEFREKQIHRQFKYLDKRQRTSRERFFILTCLDLVEIKDQLTEGRDPPSELGWKLTTGAKCCFLVGEERDFLKVHCPRDPGLSFELYVPSQVAV